MSLSGPQVTAYLDRISLPDGDRALLKQGPDSSHALMAVTSLQAHHLRSVPFENLDLSYSSHHSVPQDIATVYHRVVNLKRGGVCDQIQPLFTELLRYFGFLVYCAGSRINAAAGIGVASGQTPLKNTNKTGPQFGPWIHLNNIVTIGDLDYVVDVSHGPAGFPKPVPLVHDQPQHDIGQRQCRMIQGPLPGLVGERQKWWRMQIRDVQTKPWLDVWAFTETEWLPFDFQLLRLGYSQLGMGWVEPTVCCFQTTYEGEEPSGFKVILGDELRQGHKGKIRVLKKFYSERERVQALGSEFGITLDDDEQRQIAGCSTELQDDDFNYYG